VPDRNAEDAIAAQMIKHGIEVLLGGGSRNFLPEESGGRRGPGDDLLAAARRAGITVVTDRDGLAAAGPGPLVGLFASSHMSYALDRDPAREPSLPEMTRAALDRLKDDPDGFFLMVEGSRVDHAAHDHDAAAAAREAIEFDATVAVALAFARSDRRTLVVATADHETGGLSLGRSVDGASIYAWSAELLRAARRSAEAMAARIERGASPREVLAEDAGVSDVTEAEAAALAGARGDALSVAIGEAVSRRARIGWTTLGHTAVDVPVWAFGPGAERLRGVRANDALGRDIAACLGLRIGDVLVDRAGRGD
jgi:alkaline phosphatase